MNDAARKDDELSKQDIQVDERDVMFSCEQWLVMLWQKKRKKYFTINNNQTENNNVNKEKQEFPCPNAVEPSSHLLAVISAENLVLQNCYGYKEDVAVLSERQPNYP